MTPKFFIRALGRMDLRVSKMVNSVGEQVWGKNRETSLVWDILA